ncbi:MAG: NUDIX hydrolase [Betaproteobacteria bacterium]
MPEATILRTERAALSPWVTLVTRVVGRAGAEPQSYHSLEQADYVSVLALTPDGQVPLVRQFRPAVQRVTLELPGGLMDPGEAPARVAERELAEEAGLAAYETVALGKLIPDTGRLENRFWCFFIRAREMPRWRPERDVERVMLTPAALRQEILGGEFDHALHIALVGLALMHGQFNWDA